MAVQQTSIPLIDVSALMTNGPKERVARSIGEACRDAGFFYIVGHGVDRGLQERLAQLSQRFFEQDLQTKMKIRMELAGPAWRGYFPVGGELTSGRPDGKEGIYFGSELGDDHAKVLAGLPLHGNNQFPDIPLFRETVLQYLDAMTRLGHRLMEGLALSLGLAESYFRDHYTGDPTILFRIFHYPAMQSETTLNSDWGVGEHTDYGLLTILRQDDVGGLQVKTGDHWTEATPIPSSFVCNIGDMLDRLSGGLYRSTPHRVLNKSGQSRYSFPFFFDPGFDAEVNPIFPDRQPTDDAKQRWDGANLDKVKGTYGDYLLGKVAKVFPALGQREL